MADDFTTDDMIASVYLMEVWRQCEIARRSWTGLQERVRRFTRTDDHWGSIEAEELVWESAQELLSAHSMISKIASGTGAARRSHARKDGEKRAEWLRARVPLLDDPVFIGDPARYARNGLEHFDQRIDEALSVGPGVVSLSGIGVSMESTIRQLDYDTWRIVLPNGHIDLVPTMESIERLRSHLLSERNARRLPILIAVPPPAGDL
jgi:hypothetical protein